MIGALLATLAQWGTSQRAFRDMVVQDNFALFFNVVICYSGPGVLLVDGLPAAPRERLRRVLRARALRDRRLMLLAAAGDLVVVFPGPRADVALALRAAGLFKRELASGEASMKYFLLGAFASSFLLYGIALIYGATGTTSLDRIAAAMTARPRDPLFVMGLGLVLVGFGFKISSVPFHMWVPDVYQGAPTSVTALIPRAPRPEPSQR